MDHEHDVHFVIAKTLEQTAALRAELEAALSAAPEPRARALAADAAAVPPAAGSAPLTLAFVGQYNAGKSTLLRALTGRDDIPVDADVCTHTVTAYDWHGVRLLDTPGVHAGYPDHDEATWAVIDRADLLVFVITSELFDERTAAHFREIALVRGKARETMLVVNKVGQDPGAPEIKLREIAAAVAPLSPEDLRVVLIDALAWIEARDADHPDERRELRQISNLGALHRALDRFVAERGLGGRLTAPLFALRALADQATALLSVDRPEERAALELLHRKRSILLASRARLRAMAGGLAGAAARDIGANGDEVAEAIAPGAAPAEIQALQEGAHRRAAARADRLADEARAAAEMELADLRRQLTALQDGVLARELRALLEAAASPAPRLDLAPLAAGAGAPDLRAADWPAQARRIADLAKRIGGLSTAAPLAAGLKIAAPSAVRAVRAVGNAARVIAAVGAVVAVAAQIAEDRQEQRLRAELRRARDGVRAAYRETARDVEASCWEQLEGFYRAFYDAELAAVDQAAAELTGRRRSRGEVGVRVTALTAAASRLIDEIHAAPDLAG